MIAVILVVAFGTLSFLLPRYVLTLEQANRFGVILVAGFLARMGAALFLREVPIFSHGMSNAVDAGFYEYASAIAADVWYGQGYISFLTADDVGVPQAQNAMLAVNAYALIHYLNGGDVSRMGCVALNAFLACMTCLQLVRLGKLIGGNEHDSQLVATAMLFSPGFVFHTADLFKDGISAFLVLTAVVAAFRLAERASLVDLVVGTLALWGIWYVRFYLVFLVSAPLVLSLLGFRSPSAVRAVFALAFTFAAGLVIIATTDLAETALDLGVDTYEHASSSAVLNNNAEGGSGVRFDDSNPWISFPQKLLYTLFAPFPWQSGSIALQGGKIDCLIWYYFLYRAVRAARVMWREDRGTLIMFLVVLVPLTFAYATTMSNVGLMLRQRIPIVMLGSVLAVRDRRSASQRDPSTAEPTATDVAPAAAHG